MGFGATKPGARVAVYGATGLTGRFVAELLAARGFRPVLVGRNAEALARLSQVCPGAEVRVAAIDDPAALDAALRDTEAVIHCAGPFLDTATAVIEAALRNAVHYIDVTAEQPSAMQTFERFSSPAREAGAVVLPAFAFYGGLGDLLATAAMGDWPDADSVEIVIALDGWHPTEGTLRTGERNTATRMVLTGGRLEPLPRPPPRLQRTLPAPFGSQDLVELPFSETVLIPRHLRIRELHSFINEAPLAELRNPSTPTRTPSDSQGRSAQLFRVEVSVRRSGQLRRATVRGRDIYASTAPLVVEAVARLLSARPPSGGVFAPGELFDARAFLEALAPEHFELAFES